MYLRSIYWLLVAVTMLLSSNLVSAAENFDYSGFSSKTSMNDVQAEIKSTGKPGIVFVTQPWCGACKGLKGSVNEDSEINSILSNFVVSHASGDSLSAEWHAPGESDGYIPRVYFLDKNGEFVKVMAPNPDYAYFFPDANTVKAGLKQVLDGAVGEL
ncbi:hypothetical protein TL16_g09985 [Triparma laevis f. inornata]|uniref:Thioredoxin domain-containing protein n=1 Tax=Triparma laevis f. inornata TaxID=1714386 RepID=A0A9W7BBH7_9STRA|nr:hypothetical protein TL16_g09985 [Triparma laevis f. inornata]